MSAGVRSTVAGGGHPAGADRERDSGRADVVGQFHSGERVAIAEGGVEALQAPAQV